MSRVKGVDIVIYVDTSASGTATWTVVGGQTGAKLSESNDIKESPGYKLSPDGNAKKREYGQYSWNLSCDGLKITDDAALAKLKTACRTQTKVKVRLKEGTDYTEEGTALISSMDLDAPYEDEATYSVELQGDGALTEDPTT